MGRGDTVIGYVCVRAEEQAASVLRRAEQRAAIEAGCARRGWQLLRIQEDVLDGTRLNRPGFWAALDSCRSGEADGLVVAKLDRISRGTLDFAGLLADAYRCDFKVVALDIGFDSSTTEGELVANVIASVAQCERLMIRDALVREYQPRRGAALQVWTVGGRAAFAAGRRARTAAVPVARRAWRGSAHGLELARPHAVATARAGIEVAAYLSRIALRLTGALSVALARALDALLRRLQPKGPVTARGLRGWLRRLVFGARKSLGRPVAVRLRAELSSWWLRGSSSRPSVHAWQRLSTLALARDYAALGARGREDALVVSKAVQRPSLSGATLVERALDELAVESDSFEVGGARD